MQQYHDCILAKQNKCDNNKKAVGFFVAVLSLVNAA